MRRREFVGLLGGAAATWPFTARAQQPALPVIGFMSGRSPDDSRHLLAAFHQGLGEAGFTEGKNVAIEYRWALGHYDRLPALADELVKQRVAVLVAVGGDPSADAAKQATATISVVFGIGGDPVKAGLVQSLARPGGNATGYALLGPLREPKRLGMLHDLVPNASVIGVLLNAGFAPAEAQLATLEKAAETLGQRIEIFKASNDTELAASLELLGQHKAGALLVMAS